MPQIRISDAVDKYLAFRKNTVSNGTTATDRRALNKLLVACGNIYVHHIQPRHRDLYVAEAGRTCRESTMQTLFSAVNAFFKWCRTHKYMPRDHDPFGGVQFKRRKRQHLYVPAERFGEALDAAGRRHPRDRVMLAMLIYTLKRRSEIASVKVGDVDLAGRTISMYNHKAQRPMRVPIPAVLDRELRSWLTYYAEQCGELQAGWFLVPAKEPPRHFFQAGKWHRNKSDTAKLVPTRSCYRVVSRVVRLVLEDMGIDTYDEHGEPKWVGGHTWRRSGGQALVRATGRTRHAMAAMDHKSERTTELYLDINRDHDAFRELVAGDVMYPSDAVALGQVSDLSEERRRRGAASEN